MQYIERIITGIDGSSARLTGYVIDNSSEIDPDRRRPAVLVLPGGGYYKTSDREAEPIALKFVGAGYHAFVLRYSCAPSRYPVALCEAAEAMRMMHAHADEWHIDPQRIAILGFSAGGHLAANLATSAGDDDLAAHGYDPDAVRPNALMLAYPVITSGRYAHRGSFDALLGVSTRWLVESADAADAADSVNATDSTNAVKSSDSAASDQTARLLGELSIERHIDANTPPVFVWHTVTDNSVPVENTLLLVQACKDAGVSVEAHLFPEGWHGLSLGTLETAWKADPAAVFPCIQIWPRLALDWMERTFAKATADESAGERAER